MESRRKEQADERLREKTVKEVRNVNVPPPACRWCPGCQRAALLMYSVLCYWQNPLCLWWMTVPAVLTALLFDTYRYNAGCLLDTLMGFCPRSFLSIPFNLGHRIVCRWRSDLAFSRWVSKEFINTQLTCSWDLGGVKRLFLLDRNAAVARVCFASLFIGVKQKSHQAIWIRRLIKLSWSGLFLF